MVKYKVCTYLEEKKVGTITGEQICFCFIFGKNILKKGD